MVSIEGSVVYTLDSQSDFAAALTVLFACFYVFNIEYQETASATLELIQRYDISIFHSAIYLQSHDYVLVSITILSNIYVGEVPDSQINV